MTLPWQPDALDIDAIREAARVQDEPPNETELEARLRLIKDCSEWVALAWQLQMHLQIALKHVPDYMPESRQQITNTLNRYKCLAVEKGVVH